MTTACPRCLDDYFCKGRHFVFISDFSDVPYVTQIALFVALASGFLGSTSQAHGDDDTVLCWKALQIGPSKR